MIIEEAMSTEALLQAVIDEKVGTLQGNFQFLPREELIFSPSGDLLVLAKGVILNRDLEFVNVTFDGENQTISAGQTTISTPSF